MSNRLRKKEEGLAAGRPVLRRRAMLLGGVIVAATFGVGVPGRAAAQSAGGERPQAGVVVTQPDGHRRMVALLAEIVARTDDDNVWLGDRRAR